MWDVYSVINLHFVCIAHDECDVYNDIVRSVYIVHIISMVYSAHDVHTVYNVYFEHIVCDGHIAYIVYNADNM